MRMLTSRKRSSSHQRHAVFRRTRVLLRRVVAGADDRAEQGRSQGFCRAARAGGAEENEQGGEHRGEPERNAAHGDSSGIGAMIGRDTLS
jgi:hypothetical protein